MVGVVPGGRRLRRLLCRTAWASAAGWCMVPALAMIFARAALSRRSRAPPRARHVDGGHPVHLDLQPARAPSATAR
ncbi:MAG: hypothetical protein MZW92_64380 [Comamonadaceae bacterium]|nr:hypothetical protein [Comamonadaceae bacterium]